MTDKNREIEEMAKDLCGYSIDTEEDAAYVAKILIDKGYRKTSEVFEEIEQLMNEVYSSVQYGCYSYGMTKQTDSPSAQRQMGKLEGVKHLGDAITELKKKYTEREKDDV